VFYFIAAFVFLQLFAHVQEITPQWNYTDANLRPSREV